jgi:hypothetical protein
MSEYMSWNVAPAFARAGPLTKPWRNRRTKRPAKGVDEGSWEGQRKDKDECGPVKRIAADDWDLAEGCQDEWTDTVGWNIE